MNQPSAVKHKLSVIHKKKTQQESLLQYLPVQSFTYKIKLSMKSIFHSLFNKSIWNKKKKNLHDAGNIPLFFKTNIKYICLKGKYL